MKILLAAIALLTLASSDAFAFGRDDDMTPRYSCSAFDKAGVRYYGWGRSSYLAGREAIRKCTARTQVGGCYLSRACSGHMEMETIEE